MNRTTDTWSSSFDSFEEKIKFLSEYIVIPSEVKDAEYHIVYHDNSGGMVPGPSDWDIRVALKILPEYIPLWREGMKKLIPRQIDNSIWDGLATANITWQDTEMVEYWKRPDFPIYLVVYPDSGVLLKMMTTRHQPTYADVIFEDEIPLLQKEPVEKHGDWKEIYAEYLNKGGFYGFYIGDISGSGFPSLVIRKDDGTRLDDGSYIEETNSGFVYSITDDGVQVLDLNATSVWGKAGYLEETKQIVFLRWYGHTQATFGSVEFFLYDWTPNGYVESISVVRESGFDALSDGKGEYGQGFINRELVDFQEFEMKLAEMYTLLGESTWFLMTNANDVGDYWVYLVQWESANRAS
jgi:hypothetical protein